MDGLVKKSAIAIIPARGGSKRIPRKNIVDFLGRPMIAWTIQAALDAGEFDRVVVSTDSEEIAETSRHHGAEAPFLRELHTDDNAPSSLATLAALAQSENHFRESYEIAVQLMPNCPVRAAPEIKDALRAFRNRGADFQISCFAFGWMNPWWAVELDEKNHPKWVFPQQHNVRSQDQPKLYCPTGAIWVAKTERLREEKTFYGRNVFFHPMQWQSAVDIDEADDLAFARAAYQLKYK
jgi:N-acylneuraminate cytidylyltransferase